MAHNMTVTVNDTLWNKMKEHPKIRWSSVMKDAAAEKLKALVILKRLAAKSRLSEDEIERLSVELGKKINRRQS